MDHALAELLLRKAVERRHRGNIFGVVRRFEFRIVRAQIVVGKRVSAFIRPDNSPRQSEP